MLATVTGGSAGRLLAQKGAGINSHFESRKLFGESVFACPDVAVASACPRRPQAEVDDLLGRELRSVTVSCANCGKPASIAAWWKPNSCRLLLE
jgi:hypothetical protein